MNDTRPPGILVSEASTRSVWSYRDEAALQELAARKQRIMDAHRENLVSVLRLLIHGHPDSENFISNVIAIAEPLRDALAPFDGRTAK